MCFWSRLLFSHLISSHHMIDPSEYVESPTNTLKFANEKQQARFELAVCMAVYKWEELAIAVDNQWGGPLSADKRDWISGLVVDLFGESKIVDIQSIEETLLYAMVDEFDVEIDNDSALEISALIMQFFKDVANDKYDEIERIYNKWLENQQKRQKIHVTVDSDPNNPSDDDEDNDEQLGNDAANSPREPQQPIIDDDGFTLVQKKRR